MIILVLLIYGIAKLFHLPALIFILIFGLFIGNIDELRHYKFIQKISPSKFQ
jgi:cell volume regulation protein A